MADDNEKLNFLIERIDHLLKKQEDFSKEIAELREELNKLKAASGKENQDAGRIVVTVPPIPKITVPPEEMVPPVSQVYPGTSPSQQPQYSAPYTGRQPGKKHDLEKNIGENLINKIGIVILVIGVAIGAKYSIEHDLISPATRIMIGYLVGFGLLAFGWRLKKNYENFSAVLVSGAIAIMYFITYAAYTFYSLFPQMVAFVLMVIFTVLTVFAAILYNKQVIANIGLVGAYAVPLLLSEDAGNVAILFTYMAIINAGILVIAVKKYWKSVYYSSFILTWLIFILWYVARFDINLHLTTAVIFLTVFFVTFYAIFLAYKLSHKEKFSAEDIIMLLSNSFIFYGLGYSIISSHESGERLLGLFTLANAAIHFVVSAVIYMQKTADRNLYYLVTGLSLVFITIAIPVQLDGNWVTLLWAGEAALMFWIGRARNVQAYEKISYGLMILAFFSLVHDWSNLQGAVQAYERTTPFLNVFFLTSVFFILAFAFINYINRRIPLDLTSGRIQDPLIGLMIPAILLIVLYFSFRIEIGMYWDQKYVDSIFEMNVEGQDYPIVLHNEDMVNFKNIWIINYTLLFFSVLAYVNHYRIKSKTLHTFILAFLVLAVVVFLTQGLYALSLLRENYLENVITDHYQRSSFNIWIRYITLAFAGFALLAFAKTIPDGDYQPSFNAKLVFEFLLLVSVLWIASSELISWMDIFQSSQSDKLGLSILWGVYSLLLIALGIWKKKKHLRISAIILFAVTLIKLFFYDITYLDTISKTIVFVSLGILLLVISFLYNKYKQFLSNEIEGQP